jgi:hypothetical protein
MSPKTPKTSGDIENRIDYTQLCPKGRFLYDLLSTVKRNRQLMEQKKEAEQLARELKKEQEKALEAKIMELRKEYDGELTEVACAIISTSDSMEKAEIALAAKRRGLNMDTVKEICVKLIKK